MKPGDAGPTLATGAPTTAASPRVAARPITTLRAPTSRLEASFAPADGCELSGLTVRDDDGRAHELLYRGNDWRPVTGWQGRAPWLWPAAGRSYAPGDHEAAPAGRTSYAWNNRVYPMPVHGLIRHRAWRVEQVAPHFIAACDSRDDEHSCYPFDYRVRLAGELRGDELCMTWTCEASPRNDGPMPFMFGNHLTLDLRRWWGAAWLNGTIHGLADHGYDTDARMQKHRRLALPRALRMDDARCASLLVPAAATGPVRLTSPDGLRTIRVSLEAEDASTLFVLYREPHGAFFCCEPWIGWPNALNTGEGRVDLPPGATWRCTLRLGVACDGKG